MKTVCIIQARRGSSRLQDKILKPVAGQTILEHVIERASLIRGVDEVVCATVDDLYHQPVMDLAAKAGAGVFAGSEFDVLDRYYRAAVAGDADVVMRVTADCPLLDPYICSGAVENVKQDIADYSAVAGEWPHGMDCEVFSFTWLEKAQQLAVLPEDREHVTLWMKGHANIRRKTINPEIGGLRTLNRWVVDYPEDYEFLLQFAAVAPDGRLPLRWQDILRLVDANEGLRDINKHCEALWEKENQAIYKLANEQR